VISRQPRDGRRQGDNLAAHFLVVARSGAKVRLEKRNDAPSRVHCGWLVVAYRRDAQHLQEALAPVLVHERVAGFGVLLHFEAHRFIIPPGATF
jgi:hypothetical protein